MKKHEKTRIEVEMTSQNKIEIYINSFFILF